MAKRRKLSQWAYGVFWFALKAKVGYLYNKVLHFKELRLVTLLGASTAA